MAKNFLTVDELAVLNKIVTAYLEFAELQAMNRRPMHMADWIAQAGRLPEAERAEGCSTASSSITHADAVVKAQQELDKYNAERAKIPTLVDPGVRRRRPRDGGHREEAARGRRQAFASAGVGASEEAEGHRRRERRGCSWRPAVEAATPARQRRELTLALRRERSLGEQRGDQPGEAVVVGLLHRTRRGTGPGRCGR